MTIKVMKLSFCIAQREEHAKNLSLADNILTRNVFQQMHFFSLQYFVEQMHAFSRICFQK